MTILGTNDYVNDINSMQSDITFEIYFQIGFHREAVSFVQNDLSLNGLLEKACLVVENQFSQPSLGPRLMDNINLFLHDIKSDNILRLLKNSEELLVKEKDVIEIVLSSKFCDSNIQICQHDLNVHSFHSPAFCDFCGEMLWGIVRQGLRCKGCGQNYHKRCAYKIPNDCNLNRKRKNGGSFTDDLLSVYESRSPVFNCSPPSKNQYLCRPLWMETLPKIKVPHSFQVHTFKKPTRCGMCRKILLGVYKQGLQCKDCKLNCHKKCREEIPDSCPGEEEKTDLSDSYDNNYDDYDDDMSEENEAMETLANNGECMNGNSQNIPLMRVFQSVKQKKTYSNTVLKDGWLFHFSNDDATPQRRRHFWRLDTKSITLFRRETGSNIFKKIPLSDILNVIMRSPSDPGIPHFSFRIQTKSLELFVSDESSTESQNIASWHGAILRALNPVDAREAPTDSSPALDEAHPDQDITQIYQIHPDEVLGSGQFGIVYGGKHRKMGFDVAVKVVDKQRFESKEEDRLRREVDILQGLDHPGVVKLYNMLETPDKIVIVMEKLRGDMLEMILSSEKKRLSERITKFLITQILNALQYLHRHDIVHCDLKPENVLISSDDQLPQLKLCDFGFARIIGRNSFRRSVVGTPAYLAPEVLRKESFNRSLDLWAVGVIVYVSLSGTFPYNEEEDINQQIQNAFFLYPPNPWKEMSETSKQFIGSLLQVKKRERLNVDKALEHEWLQDLQTWLDLRILETSIGERYLTHSSDDERWEALARANEVLVERSQLIM